jgi:hypothetical protein
MRTLLPWPLEDLVLGVGLNCRGSTRRLPIWLHISLDEANVLIAAVLPYQRHGRAVSKCWFQPDESLAENCHALVLASPA